jgi:hypothetical protein
MRPPKRSGSSRQGRWPPDFPSGHKADYGARQRISYALPKLSTGLVKPNFIGNRALADADAEHLVEQPHQPLEADRLGDVQIGASPLAHLTAFPW